VNVDQAQLDILLSQAMDELPKDHMAAIKNVAIVWADEPTEEERQQMALLPHQTLLGLYHGVPLPQRQGSVNDYPPGKITLYRGPIMRSASNKIELKAQLKHTLWHEIAHYFGLNHSEIQALEEQ